MTVLACMIGVAWSIPRASVAANVITVETFDDVGDPSCPGAACSLREAIAVAENGDTIALLAGTYTLTEQIVIDKPLSVVGAGTDETVIRPDSNGHRHFTIDAPGGTVRLERFRLTNGGGDGLIGGGGSLRLTGSSSIELANLAFTDNSIPPGSAQPVGGAIYIDGTTTNIQISSVQFIDNSSHDGGAIYARSAAGGVTIESSLFHGNQAEGLFGEGDGGALHVTQPATTATVVRSTFSGNSAVAQGGAMMARDGASVEVANSTFVENTAGSDGSAVSLFDATAAAKLDFTTLVNHSSAFVTNGGHLQLTSSALANISGCPAELVTDHSVRDVSSEANCATRVADDGDLDASIDPPLFFPKANSEYSSGGNNCPANDQRGASRGDDCGVGAVEPAGIDCDHDAPLPRNTTINCSFDVALAGAHDLAVTINPTIWSGTVNLVRGAATVAFEIPESSPDGDLSINLAHDTYQTSFAVEPAVEGNGPGDGSSGGGSDGDSNGSGESGGSDSHGGESPNADAAADAAPPPSAADHITELPFTGANHALPAVLALALMCIGAYLTVRRNPTPETHAAITVGAAAPRQADVQNRQR